MFLNRLDFLVLFAGPEGLVCAPSGFTFSPQPTEQRWIQGKCKAKGGDPFDCEEIDLFRFRITTSLFAKLQDEFDAEVVVQSLERF